jgi:hypothetical protein
MFRVIKKLRDVRLEDIPDNNKPFIIRDIPKGDKFIKAVLNGGYNVQPTPLANSLFMVKSIKEYDNGIIKTDILLILGYVTSGAPKYKGIKIFPKLPNNPGITKKKIISKPCKVILRL